MRVSMTVLNKDNLFCKFLKQSLVQSIYKVE
jgi:hypothetical protein